MANYILEFIITVCYKHSEMPHEPCTLVHFTRHFFTLPKHHAMKAYWGSGYIVPLIL